MEGIAKAKGEETEVKMERKRRKRQKGRKALTDTSPRPVNPKRDVEKPEDETYGNNQLRVASQVRAGARNSISSRLSFTSF